MPTTAYVNARDRRDVGPNPFWVLLIDGIPFSFNLGVNTRLKLSSRVPGFSSGYRAYAMEFPRMAEERLILPECRSEIGQLEVKFIDADAFLTSLFATGAAVSRTRITANATAAAVSFSVQGTTGISVDDTLFIDRETVRVTSVTPPTTIGVARGQFGSTAEAHTASSGTDLYDDSLYTRPPFWIGRVASLYLNHDEPNSVESDQDVKFAGLVDEISLDEDGTAWVVTVRSSIAASKRPIGFAQFRGHLRGPIPYTETVPGPGGALLEVERDQPEADFLNGALGDEGFLRIGDELLRVRLDRYLGTIALFSALERGALGTSAKASDPGEECWEVIPCEDNAERNASRQLNDVSTGLFHSDPVSVFLALATSTGTAGANGDLDTLPRAFGAAIPTGRFDIDRFLAVRDGPTRIMGLGLPNLIIGWGGETFELKEFAEKHLFGPFGLYLKTDDSGLISLGIHEDEYSLATAAAALTRTSDVVSPSYRGYTTGEERVLTRVEAEFTGDRREKIRIVIMGRRERLRYPDDSERTFKLDVPGGSRGRGFEEFVRDRALFVLNSRRTPSPRLTLDVGWNWQNLEIGDTVTYSDENLPNHVSGTTGVTASESFRWRVIGRRLDLESGVVALDLEAVASNRRVVAPSARIVTWNAVTFVAACSANDYTPTSNPAYPWQPTRDVSGFGVGDRVVVHAPDGSLRGVTATPTVSTISPGADEIALSGGFGAYTPVAGDILAFADYDASTTSRMRDHAALADDADRQIGTTADAPHVYGY